MEFGLSQFSDLKDKDVSRMGLMVLEGRIVIEKAIAGDVEILGLVRSEGSDEDWLAKHEVNFPVERVDHAEICRIAGFNFHHGSIALARRPELKPFEADEGEPRKPGAPEGSFLCLWNVTDPSNVGALIRSAAGLGAAGVLLGPGCADPYYRKAIRASMGNALSLPLHASDAAALSSLAHGGFDLAAATLSPSALPLSEYSPKRPFVLVVGNEGYGLPADVIDICRGEVYIPMTSGVDSLNVVVAGGICMYELFGNREG